MREVRLTEGLGLGRRRVSANAGHEQAEAPMPRAALVEARPGASQWEPRSGGTLPGNIMATDVGQVSDSAGREGSGGRSNAAAQAEGADD